MEVSGRRKIGRPKLRWSGVQKDWKDTGVRREKAQDGLTWRTKELDAPNQNNQNTKEEKYVGMRPEMISGV